AQLRVAPGRCLAADEHRPAAGEPGVPDGWALDHHVRRVGWRRPERGRAGRLARREPKGQAPLRVRDVLSARECAATDGGGAGSHDVPRRRRDGPEYGGILRGAVDHESSSNEIRHRPSVPRRSRTGRGCVRPILLGALVVMCTAVAPTATLTAQRVVVGIGGGALIPAGDYGANDKVGWHVLGLAEVRPSALPVSLRVDATHSRTTHQGGGGGDRKSVV